MRRVHLQARVKVGLQLLTFENINMYSKGSYRIKLEANSADQRCSVGRSEDSREGVRLAKQQQMEYYTKDFMIRYQNEKIELGDLVIVETPLFKYSKDAKIILKLSLLKAEPSQTDTKKSHYSHLTTSILQVRFVLNSICQYCECIFQEPFLAGLALMVTSMPVHITIQTKSYKHANEEELLLLKREVKRLRYNNYLMFNKFKKILYNGFTYQFTLPRMFVNGDKAMEQIQTSQEKLLNYLILYETAELTPEQMNYQLLSIAHKNESLLVIFNENCLKTTVFINKLRIEFEDKECRKYKQFISREEYKEKYSEEYQNIIREKLKLLKRELELGNNDETLNNLMLKMENIYEQTKPQELLIFPIILHETERRRTLQEKEKDMDSDSPTFKTRFVFILAHGYQGCPQDLNLLANGFKRRFRKSKYLILKSYQSKMSQNIQEMAKYAVEEIKGYLNSMDNQSKPYKIVMIGHSMGGLILRAAASQLQAHQKLLYCYISLGTPHLGYLQGIKFLIRAGISIFTNLYNTPCLDELSGKDQPQLHQCYMFKHSKSGTLANFKKVVLISSVNDKYVSWHSARLQIFSRDKLKQYNFIEKEMIDNILLKDSSIERIDRIEVDFKLHENNMDKLLGRTSHIKLLNDLPFIELLANACLPHILEDYP